MKRVIVSGFSFSQGMVLSYKALVLDDQVEDNSQTAAIDRTVGVDLNDSAEDIKNTIIADAVSFFEVTKHDLIFMGW